MKNSIIAAYEQKKFGGQKELPEFRSGDTIRVEYEIKEGDKVRVQAFEGVAIRLKKGFVDGSVTVRKVGANSIGVERVFPLCSPKIKEIKVLARGIVRRSRLYYLRDRSGKRARIKSRFIGKQSTKAKKS